MKETRLRDRQQGRVNQRLFLLFSPNSTLETLFPFQVIQRNMPDPGEVFRRLSAVDFAGIFTESSVQRPVRLVLDKPVLAGRFGTSFLALRLAELM